MMKKTIFGSWLLVNGYWLLANGYWLLVIGYWLFAIDCQAQKVQRVMIPGKGNIDV